MTGEATWVGDAGGVLGADEVRQFVETALAGAGLEGRSVCVVVPDPTRRCPVPLLLSAIRDALAGRARRVSVLVALGTHPPLEEAARARLLGYAPGRSAEQFPGWAVADHAWWDPGSLVEVGTLPAARLAELSGDRLLRPVPVRVNRWVVEHDAVLLVGPVVPHEVVGFSGGNKYLFPGVSGAEMVDVSHWLGALLTSRAVIGTAETPVRALIDEAARLVPADRLALCVVTAPAGDAVQRVAFGTPEAAWASAVEVAAVTHVRSLERPVQRVVSVLPARYEELWTAAKGFYKVEPVVADGGEVVIYAPHVRELSRSHPGIAKLGYHCRDYFLAQWDRFGSFPWSELAHSTHLAGEGTYEGGRERLRVHVTLATGIPEAVTRSVGLGYLDPASFDPTTAGADEGTLLVAEAGEDLYRLRARPAAAEAAVEAVGRVRRSDRSPR